MELSEHRSEIEDWLRRIKGTFGTIYEKINEGDYLKKGSEYLIHIDSIRKVIETFNVPQGVSRNKIFNHFNQHLTIRNSNSFYEQNSYKKWNYKCVDLSILIDSRVGECTEMSIVAQILLQILGRKSFWVTGFVAIEGVLSYHAFNVSEGKDGYYYILDIALNINIKIKEIKLEEGSACIIPESSIPYEYFLN
jgi:hypothetical protein